MKKFISGFCFVVIFCFGANHAYAGTTFGKFNIGATVGNSQLNELECITFTAPENGLVTSMTQYHVSAGSSATQWKGFLINAITRKILPHGISTASAVGVDNWATTTFAISPSIVSGQSYGLCFTYDGAQNWRNDNDAGHNDIFAAAFNGNFSSPPNPTNGLLVADQFTSSIYATYVPNISVEQEGFRFQNDNGSESSATGLAAQDTNITQPTLTNTRLRMIINHTGDLPTTQYQLEYKKSSDNWWTPATTTANEYAAPIKGNDGGFFSSVTTSDANEPVGGNPPFQDGDLFLLFVNTANEVITTPAGWTQVANSPQGTGTAAAAGGVRLGVFYKIITGNQPIPAVTVADSGSYTGVQVAAYRGVSTTTPFDITAGAVDAAATASLSWPAVTTSFPNEMIVNVVGLDKDLIDNDTLSAEANSNLTGLVEDEDETSSLGAGGGIAFTSGIKTTVGSTGNTTATGDTATTHAYMTLALRPTIQKILILPSPNISSSATDVTTAQLTPPSGKTSGADFAAGLISDDTNPLPTLDFGSGKYTELEWNLVATTTAATNDIYQFRVTNNGEPINTYSVTPQWTIGAPLVSGSNPLPRLVLSFGRFILSSGKFILQ